jgi:glycosyltransferase involved in cell wall biosynthesis
LPFLEKSVLAAVYRKAAVLLQPSDAEGFGLPVIEALACGTPVVASNLPVLHEVGGEAATYCPVADVSAWVESVSTLLCERQEQPGLWDRRRALGIAQAAKFSWAEYARKMVVLYQELMPEACELKHHVRL